MTGFAQVLVESWIDSRDLHRSRDRKRDIRLVMDAAGDDHLQHTFDRSDVAEGSAHARRYGQHIELLEHDGVLAVIAPKELEATATYRERLVCAVVRVQGRPLTGWTHRIRDRHAAGTADRRTVVDRRIRVWQADDRMQSPRIDHVERILREARFSLHDDAIQLREASDSTRHLLRRRRNGRHVL